MPQGSNTEYGKELYIVYFWWAEPRQRPNKRGYLFSKLESLRNVARKSAEDFSFFAHLPLKSAHNPHLVPIFEEKGAELIYAIKPQGASPLTNKTVKL